MGTQREPTTAGRRGPTLPGSRAESLSAKRWAPFEGDAAKVPLRLTGAPSPPGSLREAISAPRSPCSNLRGAKRLSPSPPPPRHLTATPRKNRRESTAHAANLAGRGDLASRRVSPLPRGKELFLSKPRPVRGPHLLGSLASGAALTVSRALQRCSAVDAGGSIAAEAAGLSRAFPRAPEEKRRLRYRWNARPDTALAGALPLARAETRPRGAGAVPERSAPPAPGSAFRAASASAPAASGVSWLRSQRAPRNRPPAEAALAPHLSRRSLALRAHGRHRRRLSSPRF